MPLERGNRDDREAYRGGRLRVRSSYGSALRARARSDHTNVYSSDRISPRIPTSIRITPTVWRSIPETCAVTAYLRIAPTAISRIDVPIVMSASIPTGPAAEPSATPASDDGSILRGATVVARQEAGPRVQASVARCAPHPARI